jgi:hypothetical protein
MIGPTRFGFRELWRTSLEVSLKGQLENAVG